MSIRNRLKQLEESRGLDLEPEVLFFTTIYEQKDGGDQLAYSRAFIENSKQLGCTSATLWSEPEEDFEAFKDRVMRIVRGRVPDVQASAPNGVA